MCARTAWRKRARSRVAAHCRQASAQLCFFFARPRYFPRKILNADGDPLKWRETCAFSTLYGSCHRSIMIRRCVNTVAVSADLLVLYSLKNAPCLLYAKPGVILLLVRLVLLHPSLPTYPLWFLNDAFLKCYFALLFFLVFILAAQLEEALGEC